MKLYRFLSSDNHKTMLKVHHMLGPEALIYSTRKTSSGIEMLAGLANDQDILENNSSLHEDSVDVLQVNNAVESYQLIESIHNQLQVMGDTIIKLAEKVSLLEQTVVNTTKKRKSFQWNIFKTILTIRKILKEGAYGQSAQ